MTPAQWKAVEESLAYPHGHAELTCDGRRIAAQVQQVKELRFEVVVFVDGVWRGEWLRADRPCDEQRFMCPHEQAFYSAAQIKGLRKVFSAKQLREMAEKKTRWFSPSFRTAKAFRRRITSTCKSIELVKCSEDEIAKLRADRAGLAGG